MIWDLSCPDWEDRVRTGRPLIPDLPLHRAEADRAVAIFNRLRVPDVPGQPSFADAGGDWFRDIVAALFGSVSPEDGQRMLREIFILVAKKNAKTTGGAALMLTALLMNRRPRAEFLLVGPTQDVSKLAFNQALGMIEADPDGFLQKRMHVREHLKEIIDRKSRAVLKIKTFDPSVLTGVKPAGVLLDELHVMATMSDADRIIGQLRGGLLPNPEAFLVFITTQSERPPAGVFRAELHKAREIRDGTLKGVPMLPVLYEFPRDIAHDPNRWQDTACWSMVTPNAGRSITVDRLAQDFVAAKATSEDEVRRWASQHLNIEIGLGLRTDRWPGAEFWERRSDPTITRESLLERCEVIIVGIDGGGLDDLFGLCLLGREKGTKRWLAWFHAWAHQSVLERRKTIAARLRDFAAAGEMTIADDELKDVAGIVAIVDEVRNRGLLGGVAVDPAGLGELVDELEAIGVTQDDKTLVGVGQGYRLMNAIKTTERKLANGTLVHSGSTLAAWCVGNLKIEPTATAIRATKTNAGDAKIDVVMGLFNAVDQMQFSPVQAEVAAMIV